MHARILLNADSGEDGPPIGRRRGSSEALEVSLPTIWRVRLLAERLVKVGEVQQVSMNGAAVLKKTNSTMAERAVVYPTQSQADLWPIWRCAGGLCPPV